MVQTQETKEAKRELFILLLQHPRDNLTDNEVEIMFLLSKDRDIQEILDKANKLKEEFLELGCNG